MIERCIFVICLDKRVKKFDENSHNDSKESESDESIEEIEDKKSLSNDNLTNGHSNTDISDANNYENYYHADLMDNEYISNSMTSIAFQMLHGCNSTNNSGNRWFDKTMQFIISEDGICGLNYEHSPAEGIVVIELSEHLFRYMYVLSFFFKE